jgi:subtilase family serine protease
VVLALAFGFAGSVLNAQSFNYNTNPPNRFAFAKPASPAAFPTPSQCVAAAGLACYTPALIRSAYDVPSSLTGAGQTIVIVDAYGSPTVASDLHIFDQEFGLADPQLNIIYPGGSPVYNPLQNHAESSWAAETSLDTQWAHAIAPGATIDLVIAANNGGNVLNNAVQYAVNNHLGNIISLSWGAPEGAISGGGNNSQVIQAHQIFQAAQQASISVFASSGDFGADNNLSFTNASYPASDPLVVSVGGTNLFMSDSGAYQSEDLWNDSNPNLCPFGCTAGLFGATGGAPSVLFPAPDFQQALSGNNMRSTSDVSYNASVYTGVLTYLGFLGGSNDGFYFFGGTSEGAPQWAAITALANQAAGHALGYLSPALYAAASGKAYSKNFHDVTFGDNAWFGPGFPAGVGYDYPTGIGSPEVSNLIGTLTGTKVK